jgi:hypothetical protein
VAAARSERRCCSAISPPSTPWRKASARDRTPTAE